MVDPFAHALTTAAQLRDVYDPPAGLAARKQIDHLDDHCRAFIACSPLVLMATADAAGRCDATPRGGPPGFVSVLDEHLLAIPDATGNRRVDAWHNVISNGHAGLVFLIPGQGWTLRVNGRACVTDHADVLGALTAVGKPPRLALVVEAEEVFTHCPKAFVRSRVWEPDTWPAADEQPDPAAMLHAHAGDGSESVPQVREQLRESLRSRLA